MTTYQSCYINIYNFLGHAECVDNITIWLHESRRWMAYEPLEGNINSEVQHFKCSPMFWSVLVKYSLSTFKLTSCPYLPIFKMIYACWNLGVSLNYTMCWGALCGTGSIRLRAGFCRNSADGNKNIGSGRLGLGSDRRSRVHKDS